MEIYTLDTGLFKLDGGAMFGVVPKQLWQKQVPADGNNMCTWAMRCLLVRHQDRIILVDTGLGNKQDEKFRSHFEPYGLDSLTGSLKNYGVEPEDVTDVFITHMHFDHVGGAVNKDSDGKLYPAFPNAKYWSNKSHYEWAIKPNAREAASFLKENILPLQDAGVLNFIDEEQGIEWIPGIEIFFMDGHTGSMMTPLFNVNGRKLFYPTDLLPSSAHIGLPYIMSYDVRPLDTLKEKTEVLNKAVDENWVICFEHDQMIEAARVVKNDRGRIVIGESGNLSDLLG